VPIVTVFGVTTAVLLAIKFELIAILVELIKVLTVVLPIKSRTVSNDTLAPTFNAVVRFAVAGSLAVFNVPEVILVAIAEKVVALATALAKAVAAIVSEYALRVVAVLPPTVLASTLVIADPTPEKDPAVIRPVNVAVLPIIDVELIVTLPTLTLVVLAVTTEPTFNAVVRLAVAGSLAVSSVPEVILVAIAEKVTALEYAVAAIVSEYALRVVAVLPPTVLALTLVILTPLPVITLATKLAVVLIRVELTVVLPEVIKDAFTTLNTALAPPIIEVELANKLTVVLPIDN
jgi:hypothetical protein